MAEHNYRYLWIELAAWHRFWTAPVSYGEVAPPLDRLNVLVVVALIFEFWTFAYITGLLRPLS